MDNTFKIRDLRRTHFHTVDNLFIDEYAKSVGTIASMIYIVLCRHADKEQTAFPSQDTIAEKIGVARETVNRNLKLLTDYNIISYTKTKDITTGEQLNNTYTLMDKSAWKPCDAESHGSDVTQNHTAHAQTRVTQNHTNNTGTKNTNIEKNSNKEDFYESEKQRHKNLTIKRERRIPMNSNTPRPTYEKKEKSSGRRAVYGRDII